MGAIVSVTASGRQFGRYAGINRSTGRKMVHEPWPNLVPSGQALRLVKSGWRKHALFKELLPKANAQWQVDSQDCDHRAASWRASHEDWTAPAKMALPFVPARVEERNDPTRPTVNSR